VELKNVCCRGLSELRRELPKAKERLRHKKHVIFGCIRQPGFEEERDKIGKPWRDHGLVFCTQVGTPLNRNNIHTRSFKPLVERAGLPPTLRFHDCQTHLRDVDAQGWRAP